MRRPTTAGPPDLARGSFANPRRRLRRVAELPLRIDRCELLPLARDTSSGFTKVSTVVRLTGDGHEGQGEDITWDQIDQIEQLRRAGDLSWLRGRRTLDEFSTLLGLADLFPVEPIRESARDYRRWAFESAALDLALRQNGLSLQDAVGRAAQPVTFVVSMRIADAAGLGRSGCCAAWIRRCGSSSIPRRAGTTGCLRSWRRSPASTSST